MPTIPRGPGVRRGAGVGLGSGFITGDGSEFIRRSEPRASESASRGMSGTLSRRAREREDEHPITKIEQRSTRHGASWARRMGVLPTWGCKGTTRTNKGCLDDQELRLGEPGTARVNQGQPGQLGQPDEFEYQA